MASLIKWRNGDFFPAKTNDFWSTRWWNDNLLNDNFWDGGLKVPLANVSENKNEFRLELSAPGLKKEDFKIELEDGVLTISSEKKEENKDDKENYQRREFSYAAFSRSFQLPDNAEEEKINASYENGVLHISIPKREGKNTKPKKAIQIT